MNTERTNSLTHLLLSALCALALVAAAFLAGCAQTQPVAATVGGITISEQDVTDYIQSFREANGYSDDASWAAYLEERGETPEGMRRSTVYELAADEVIERAARERGLSVDDSEVQAEIDALRESLFSEDDDVWAETLELYKTDEASIRENARRQLLSAKVYEEVVEQPEASDEEAQDYIDKNLLGTTAKDVVRVYAPDYTSMQALLREVQAAQDRLAVIDGVRDSAGEAPVTVDDYGWDVRAGLSEDEIDAIEDLHAGDVVDVLVSSADGYVLLYCTDEYSFAQDGAPFADLPASLQQAVKDAVADSQWDDACLNWLRSQLESLELADMPSGLPYDVEGSDAGGANGAGA